MKAWTKLAPVGSALIALTILSACTVTRKPDGTWTVTEAANPAYDGNYSKVNIGGRCYLSNGTVCIPCDGGKPLPCEEVRRVLGETPWTEQRFGSMGSWSQNSGLGDGGGEMELPPEEPTYPSVLEPSETMLWSVGALSGGLTADELSESLGLDTWQPGIAHTTVFSVNSFDSNSGIVDFTYITAWGASAPAPGQYSNGVTVEYYFLGGDLTDNVRDAVAIRLAGPFEAVANAAMGIGPLHGQISTEYGLVTMSFGEGQDAVLLDGVTIWDR